MKTYVGVNVLPATTFLIWMPSLLYHIPEFFSRNIPVHLVFALVMVQAVRRCFLTTELRVQSQMTLCEVHGGRSGTRVGVFSRFLGFLLYITPFLHTSVTAP
jgi:uncharacterized protein YqgC (DUF456 family)